MGRARRFIPVNYETKFRMDPQAEIEALEARLNLLREQIANEGKGSP